MAQPKTNADSVPGPDPAPPRQSGAPVLFVPAVLSPDLSAALIAAHDADHTDSGMLRDVDGTIDLIPDATAKVRTDHHLTDPALTDRVMRALAEKVLPAIKTAFAYDVTRLERIKIVAYDAQTGGHFAAHRDNTTPDAAHRRFALTLNLDGPDYEGGVLRFPEFGEETYAPPAGGAIVFSCGLLHEVLPVTAGRRYALLTFFYGDREAAARKAAGRETRP